MRDHWFAFFFVSNMEWLFLKTSNISVFSVSIPSSKFPNRMPIKEIKVMGDGMSRVFTFAFTAVGCSTSSS